MPAVRRPTPGTRPAAGMADYDDALLFGVERGAGDRSRPVSHARLPGTVKVRAKTTSVWRHRTGCARRPAFRSVFAPAELRGDLCWSQP